MERRVSGELQREVFEGIAAGMTPTEIQTALGIANVSAVINRLIELRRIERIGRGQYQVAVMNGNGKNHSQSGDEAADALSQLGENATRRVDLPDYMRARDAITLFVERSPQEIEGVMRIELHIGGMWFPIPVTRDLRLCVGDDIPRWSATQETYNGVIAFRVTFRNGAQREYGHDPKVPLTVDVK